MNNNNNIKQEENDALTFNDKIYSQLTRIYNLLNEQDTVLALSTNFAKMQETKDGVESYMKGNYSDAYQSYVSAQKIATQQGNRCIASVLEKTLWNEESIKCLHKLAKWDMIYDNTMHKIENIDTDCKFEDNLWNFLLHKQDLELTEQSIREAWFSDWLLSAVKKEEIWNNQLYKYMDEWIKINENNINENQKQKRDYMENNKYNSIILAFLYSTKNDLIRTKYYCNKSYEIMLDKWCNLPRFAVNAKKLLLSKLQTLVEINEFVNIVQMESDHKMNNDSEDILTFWKHRYPKITDDVLIWDDISFYRQIYANKINLIESADYLKELMTECQIDTLYESINAMIYQKNYTVAQKYMSCAALLGSHNPKFKLQHLQLSLNSIMDDRKKNDKEKLQSIQQLNEKLTNHIGDMNQNNMNDFENTMYLLKAQMLFRMATFIDENGALIRYINIQNIQSVNDIYNQSQSFYRKSLNTFTIEQEEEKELKYAVDGDINMENNHDMQNENDNIDIEMDDEGREINAQKQKLLRKHEYNQSKAHIELALFCNRRLLTLEEQWRKESEKNNNNSSIEKIKLFTIAKNYNNLEIELGREFIENIMRAMVYNNDDAVDMFPRVLEIAEMNTQTLGVLINKLSKRIPVWMFIRWIAQMLAELGSNSKLRDYVLPILIRIANLYPNALVYPFNLTSKDLEKDKLAKPSIDKLSHVLQQMRGYELICSFTEALDCMCHPNLKFKDYTNEINTCMKDKHLDQKEKYNIIEHTIRDMIYDLFTPNKKYVKKLTGVENQRFHRCFAKTMFQRFGKNCEKIKKMPLQTIKNTLQKVQSHREFKPFNRSGGKVALNLYSDWLSSFDASKYETDLYIPGQFSGMRKPNLSALRSIVSFDSRTLIMGSLRRPKRIKLRTNDEREEMWLVKAGEDLRMDQRIEQMFFCINNILCKNALCIERNLSLRTYAVIPLNRSTGIIEWIPNTIPIKSLVCDSMKRLKIKQSMTDIILKSYIPAFTKAVNMQHKPQMYCKIIERYKQSNINKQLMRSFITTQNKLPTTTLQLSINNMSRNKESYIKLRSRFCKTLSVYTICGYILGIGDRHLDNYLVDESNGQVIGIDFGAAFGYGLGLPVPELMPCRLTRQFLNIMSPLNTKIHMRNYMIYCMNAIQEKKDNLLNIMNVFIKEPSLDWMEQAQKNFDKANTEGIMGAFDVENDAENESKESQTQTQTQRESLWYPKHKIYIAKLKLNCYKSTYVMREEIHSTQHFKSPTLRKGMELLINGFTNDKLRKKFTKNKCDSTEDQIDCLIDHADDNNILSVTWQGWSSWI